MKSLVGKALWNRRRAGLFRELPAVRNCPIRVIHRLEDPQKK